MNQGHSKGHLKNSRSLLFLLAKLFDAACIVVLLTLLAELTKYAYWDSALIILSLSAVTSFFFIAEIAGLYRSWRGVPIMQWVARVAITWFCSVTLLLFIAYIFNITPDIPHIILSAWILLAPVILSSWRMVLRLTLNLVRSNGYNSRNIAIVGAGEMGVQVASTVKSSPWLGLNLLGFFDDRSPESDRLTWDGRLLGTFDNLVEKVHLGEVDVIYITLPLSAQPRIMKLLDRLADSTVSIYLVPDFFMYSLFHGQWKRLEGLSMVSVFDRPFLGAEGWSKRAQDVILSSVILLFISVPMLIIAMAVKLSSPGPVFFKQRRYGIDGREIMVWKFRSMNVQENDSRVIQAIRNDPRVTKVGAFLRRTSLDELPQFINVFLGDMSIVGPRPHAVAHNEEYRPVIRGYMLRHAVKPGITGWAQVNGWRGETESLDKMEKRIEFDHWYIRNCSLWLDLKIICLTMLHGFVGKSTY